MRFLVWILLFSFAGFFFADKGAEVTIADLVFGTFIGALIGVLVGLLFHLREKRKINQK